MFPLETDPKLPQEKVPILYVLRDVVSYYEFIVSKFRIVFSEFLLTVSIKPSTLKT